MKRVTILSLHLNIGGIERYVVNLANMLSNYTKVTIVSTYKFSDTIPFKLNSNVNIVYLTNDYPDRVSLKDLVKSHKYIKAIKEYFRRLFLLHKKYALNIKYIKNIDADYLITTRLFFNQLVNKYLKNKNVVSIVTEHNYPNDDKYPQDIINATTNFDYFVHCTHELYNFYEKDIKGPKNVYIANSLEKISKEKSNLKTKNIIAVGRLAPEKGFLDLIDVMAEVAKIDKSIILNLVGDGYLRNQLQDKIDLLNLKNVKLLGSKTGDDLTNLYLGSSLYVMTSYTEAFGLVLLEAMNYGLPCIAFDSASGARELLKNDKGFLIKNRDVKEMAKKIVEILSNKKELIKYQNIVNEYIKHFTNEEMLKEWKKII